MAEPHPSRAKSGAPGIAGQCPSCGSRLFRRTAGAAQSASSSKAPARRKGNLVIVESPTKARTIQRYLGRGYTVKASIGHVRDLLRSRLSVDTERNYEPTYRIPNDKRAVVRELKQAVDGANEVYLATDLDREGEAIAWHIMAATGLDPERARRVVFHEITQDAIREAFQHPRAIDHNLVDAQQARRILDRLVGYQLTPLLWEKVRSRLSAGRVQSVAVRLIVEREREIQAFVPEEYWTVDALLARVEAHDQQFKAALVKADGKDADLPDEESATQVCERLKGAAFRVDSIKRGTRRRSPPPPFTTSTLQQEASRVLRFQASRTMRVAQQLYEGVDLGPEGSVGLITYMRTDSVHVAESALREARSVAEERFGREYLPDSPRRYRTRSKRAQEAHEAIRPTSVLRTPERVAPHLSRDQLALYRLIWRRLVASQMKSAVYNTIAVEVAADTDDGHHYLFRASGSTLAFPGYLAVYGGERGKGEEPEIPELSEGEPLVLLQLLPEQHFTQPPPRYNEASLIKELEGKGIGRPSTYAAIISTIIARGYVERQQRNLVPTDIAFVVNDLLVEYFPRVMDVGFTAQMEDDLDEIAAGRKKWVPVVDEFYRPFSQRLEHARREIKAVRMRDELAGVDCDVCGAPMLIKYGRFGKFIGCSNYPECRNTRPFLEKIGVTCPECGSELVQRRSRRGRVFYGCEAYPECRFATHSRPLKQRCLSCGGLMVQKGRSAAQCLACGKQAPLERSEEEQEQPVAEGS
ncbi:MAG: type I DNA topoisomerase [Anaerolineae bacterium]|nr:type I DNA topoisomerase [Anaerolineae bacterium]